MPTPCDLGEILYVSSGGDDRPIALRWDGAAWVATLRRIGPPAVAGPSSGFIVIIPSE